MALAPQETPAVILDAAVSSVGTQSFHNDSVMPSTVFSLMKCLSTEVYTASREAPVN